MNPCKYRHVFGKEGEGVHSIRLFNIAVVDVVLTVIGAIFLAKLFKVHVALMLLIVFALGIIVHRIFCVNTTVNKWIFGKV